MGSSRAARVAEAFALASIALPLACGDSSSSGLAPDGGTSEGGDEGGTILIPDAAADVGPCGVDLNCGPTCGNGAHTTVSGTVYDPAGRTPLYDVFVYIPSGTVADIPSGAACTACQAPASGSPLVSAITDAKGHFQLVDVPVGTGIPLVMQVGKWRRTITISVFNECSDNPLGKKDSKGLEQLTRLPRKQHEGNPLDNIPSIAIATGGCDALECLVRKIGIDDSEFSATGRVQIFQGAGGAVTSDSTDAQTTLWSSASTLAKYDAVLNSCECGAVDRQSAYSTVKDYIDGGGRFFGTHYHYDWFAPPNGPSDFQGTAQWLQPNSSTAPPFYVDVTFPRGLAFSDWIQNVSKIPPPKGQVALQYAAQDVGHVSKPNGTRWIYDQDSPDASVPDYAATYLTFNAPVGQKPANQCGRAAFLDAHVASGSFSGTFPSECGKATDPLTDQETALEFMFFDLFSCVQDDAKPPITPPQN